MPLMSMPPRRLTSSTHSSTPRTPDCDARAKLPVDETVMPTRILSEFWAVPVAGVKAAMAMANAGKRNNQDVANMGCLQSL
ncbi:hypothetical protein D3C87_1818980 [compost metagenome]